MYFIQRALPRATFFLAAVALVSFTGAAAAGNGNGKQNGKGHGHGQVTAPGQQTKTTAITSKGHASGEVMTSAGVAVKDESRAAIVEEYDVPASSLSGPGNSGIHKVTVCHNGHPVTADLHSAHLSKHNDPTIAAGLKTRDVKSGAVDLSAVGCGGSTAPTGTETSECGVETTTFVKGKHEGQRGNAYGLLKPRTTVVLTGEICDSDGDEGDGDTGSGGSGGSGGTGGTGSTGGSGGTGGTGGTGTGADGSSTSSGNAVLASARSGGSDSGSGLLSSGTLPLTGLSLVLVVLAGAALVGTGVAVRRLAAAKR